MWYYMYPDTELVADMPYYLQSIGKHELQPRISKPMGDENDQFFYNSIGLPVAAGVLFPAFGITLNPMIAAAAMSLSSVCVVSNALRLRGWKAPVLPHSNPETETEITNKEDITMTKKMTIEGMMCTHCSGRVETVLNALEGVSATVDLAAKTATVTLSAEVSDELLRKTVEDAGYQVISIQ